MAIRLTIAVMNYYAIWVNLIDSRRDLDFAAAVQAYLGHLKERGTLESYQLMRRKFGFGPDGLGEFHVVIATKDLAQLDAAFQVAATRAAEVETLHARVYSLVKDFRAALYRDFPDPQRAGA